MTKGPSSPQKKKQQPVAAQLSRVCKALTEREALAVKAAADESANQRVMASGLFEDGVVTWLTERAQTLHNELHTLWSNLVTSLCQNVGDAVAKLAKVPSTTEDEAAYREAMTKHAPGLATLAQKLKADLEQASAVLEAMSLVNDHADLLISKGCVLSWPAIGEVANSLGKLRGLEEQGKTARAQCAAHVFSFAGFTMLAGSSATGRATCNRNVRELIQALEEVLPELPELAGAEQEGTSGKRPPCLRTFVEQVKRELEGQVSGEACVS
ncbi:MAG: hypothetical protein GY772_25350 [bacterium]|nr:hypothetical protein [bacterium]